MKVTIVGAGATGLSSAYLLAKTGVEVEILEGSSRPGGLMNTFDVGNDMPLEFFYHHFFTHDSELNWMLSELGLDEDITYQSSTMGVYRNGKIHNFNGLKDLLTFSAMSLLGRFRFGLSSALLAYRKKYTLEENRTALEWFYRNAGKEATESIWRPMLEVKFGDMAGQIPLAWIAGRLRQCVMSRKSGVEKLGYLKGSLQRLTDNLVSKLRNLGVVLRLNQPVSGIQRESIGCSLQLPNGEKVKSDRLVLTTPTTISGKLVENCDPQLGAELSSIEYLGAICTVLSLKEKLSPIYWTNIADGNADFGGVIEQTNLVPASEYGGQHIVYLSKYASNSDSIWSYSDQELVDRQVAQLEQIYKRPLRDGLNRSWVFKSRTAAPLTGLGLREQVPTFRTPVNGLFVASMCHLYPEERSVNNSIRVAAELASEMGFQNAADLVPYGISDAGKIGRSDLRDIRRAA